MAGMRLGISPKYNPTTGHTEYTLVPLTEDYLTKVQQGSVQLASAYTNPSIKTGFIRNFLSTTASTIGNTYDDLDDWAAPVAGAQVGMLFGPWGALIGAAGGALGGAVADYFGYNTGDIIAESLYDISREAQGVGSNRSWDRVLRMSKGKTDSRYRAITGADKPSSISSQETTDMFATADKWGESLGNVAGSMSLYSGIGGAAYKTITPLTKVIPGLNATKRLYDYSAQIANVTKATTTG